MRCSAALLKTISWLPVGLADIPDQVAAVVAPIGSGVDELDHEIIQQQETSAPIDCSKLAAKPRRSPFASGRLDVNGLPLNNEVDLTLEISIDVESDVRNLQVF